MQSPTQQDRQLMRRIIERKAVVMNHAAKVDQYIAIPFADRRRRPIAWISNQVLNRLVIQGMIREQGHTYVPTSKGRKVAM